MRTTAIICCALVLAAFASAQVRFTNSVTKAGAIKAASQLEGGMWEEETGKALATNGLTNFMILEMGAQCYREYTLVDGNTLILDYAAQVVTKDGRWAGRGLLQKATITSTNNFSLIPITLKSRS